MMDYWNNWWDYYVTFDATLTANIIGKAYTIPWFSHNLADHPDYPVDMVRVGTLMLPTSKGVKTKEDYRLTTIEDAERAIIEAMQQKGFTVKVDVNKQSERIRGPEEKKEEVYDILIWQQGGDEEEFMMACCIVTAEITRRVAFKTDGLFIYFGPVGQQPTTGTTKGLCILTKICRNAVKAGNVDEDLIRKNLYDFGYYYGYD